MGNTNETMFVPCAHCGKMVNPHLAFYVARRSKVVAKILDWEYFAISPAFFCCSFEHLQFALAERMAQWNGESTAELSRIIGVDPVEK